MTAVNVFFTIKNMLIQNIEPCPIPEGAHVNNNDNRVYIFLSPGPRRSSRRLIIGKKCGEAIMQPNDHYRERFPEEYAKHYGADKTPSRPPLLKVGMYAVTLGIGIKSGLYDMVRSVYGPLHANYLMDNAMYNIVDHTDAVMHLRDAMEDRLTFSTVVPDDNRMSKLFREDMTEEQNDRFMDLWIKKCVADGVKKVWLAIDGTNIDCTVEGSVLAEGGHSKSGKSLPVVGLMRVVNAETGMPVAAFVYNGGKNDGKGIQRVVAKFSGYGISVAGSIFDRGFCYKDVLDLMRKQQMNFVVMLKSDTYGHSRMMERHAEDIRWNVSAIVNGNAVFGIQDREKIFGNDVEDSYVCLFYDGANGSSRATKLVTKVVRTKALLEEEIRDGKKLEMPSGMDRYLKIVAPKEEGEKATVEILEDVWQQDLDRKGFYSVASNMDLGAAETDRIYNLRDSSEKDIMYTKSWIGYSAARAHDDRGIRNRLTAGFIASVIRWYIMDGCKKIDHPVPTETMLTELDRVVFIRNGGKYTALHDSKRPSRELMSLYGVTDNHLDRIEEEYDKRLETGLDDQRRRLPEVPEELPHTPGRPRKQKTEEPGGKPEGEKKRRGRPKGSRNKATIEREQRQAATGGDAQEKKRPGRPKGSHNKPKPKKTDATETTKKRGRPKGSKNKKTIEREARIEKARRLAKNKEKREAGRKSGNDGGNLPSGAAPA